MKLELVIKDEVLTLENGMVEFIEANAVISVPKTRRVIMDLVEMGIPFQTQGWRVEICVDILTINKMELESEEE